MFECRNQLEKQEEIWVVAQELPKATPDRFYQRVNLALEKIGFAEQVWTICERLMRMPPRRRKTPGRPPLPSAM